jgi:hypothetical protein
MVMLAGLELALAQKSTELYIPIGQSPGVSGIQTIIGTIESVNAPDRGLVVTDEQGSATVKISDKTQIWLDQSTLKTRNQSGSFDALQPKRRVEVKFTESTWQAQVTAEWIKVQMGEGP